MSRTQPIEPLEKFLPYTGEDDGKLRFWDYQETNIQAFLDEPSLGGLIGDDMGAGKMGQAAEVVVRSGAQRALFIGVRDTFYQFRDRLYAQSDGTIVARSMDGSADGQEAERDFLAGKPGVYFAGSQYLTTQDWKHIPQWQHADGSIDGKKRDGSLPAWKRKKTTGEVMTKTRSGKHLEWELVPGWSVLAEGWRVSKEVSGLIGPAEFPQRLTKRSHLFYWRKMKAPLDLFIVDEAHVFANRQSIGRHTAKTLVARGHTRILGMSGTWYGNKFEHAWGLCRFIWEDDSIIDPNFYNWRANYCATQEVRVKGGQNKTETVVSGEKNPGEFVKTLPCYFRHEMPKPPEAKAVYVDLTEIQRAQYDELEADMLTYLRSHAGAAPLLAELPITLRSRLRTAALGEMVYDERGKIGFDMTSQSSKLTALRGVLDYYGNQPVAIYTDSKRYAKVVTARMQAAGYNAVEWSGDIPRRERDAIKQRFLAGEVQYIVAVIPAFSTGLDGFQKVCNKVIWLSESENNVLNMQAICRFWRPGRTEANGGFEHVKILARDTHDVGVYSSLVAQTLNYNLTVRKGQVALAA